MRPIRRVGLYLSQSGLTGRIRTGLAVDVHGVPHMGPHGRRPGRYGRSTRTL